MSSCYSTQYYFDTQMPPESIQRTRDEARYMHTKTFNATVELWIEVALDSKPFPADYKLKPNAEFLTSRVLGEIVGVVSDGYESKSTIRRLLDRRADRAQNLGKVIRYHRSSF